MSTSDQRFIEMHLQHGECLVARSEGGASVECARHPDLPHLYTVDAGRLAPGEPFRYVVRRADGIERTERFFTHSLDQGGPVDVWEGIRAVDNAFYATEVKEHFERRGFAVVRGVLSADVVSALRAVVYPVIADVWEKDRASYRDKINLEKVLLHVPYLLQALTEKLGPLLRRILGDAMRAGDALLLHNYVWHGSRANTSPVDRVSWLLNFAPAPSHDETNPSADLNLQILRGGVPTDLCPDVCSRLVREKHAFLNLFDGFFTYDPSLLRMVHPDNRRVSRERTATAGASSEIDRAHALP
ncbi:phytanoyl-CoA dioxygenase family protein [Sorangium sp. So ce233]|uniref:phytanoyl-CoA dioxygenase family protein n=1 Tax=Sorangium sp. So ce233 TaxID=3133290 RepID=UPI003F5FFBD1